MNVKPADAAPRAALIDVPLDEVVKAGSSACIHLLNLLPSSPLRRRSPLSRYS